ncbi:Aldose 1-epimerase [Posidoniimonas polymericola]|uniref:Aldose 1-epimerase n=1 Tax=Posidoniimonas polymericola TaxID=2528002 RepID=A0A5C5YDM9_9BACT|nr:aldose 1-epimerase [Posidoniimonas polymericola]TWT73460.1 Aldose 1-epimerase [Posidoniimonas polymericola]
MTAQIAVLEHKESGARAQVLVSQGFNCFDWVAAVGDAKLPLLYAPEGFASGDHRPTSGGTPLLFPFPGRIEEGRYSFGGKDYELPAGDAFGNAIHGFVFNKPWRIVDQSESSVTAEFVGSQDAPETLDLWPSDYAIQAAYRLEADQLVLEVTCSNPGDSDLPYGLATHAYFSLPLDPGGDPEATVLHAPVDREWAMHDMIPTGDSEQNPVVDGLAAGMPLAGQQLDQPFRLAPSSSGEVVTSLKGGGVTLEQTCSDDFRCYVVYTPGHREAVCIEPYTCVPSPFGSEQRGVDTNLKILAPGESHSYTVTLHARAN